MRVFEFWRDKYGPELLIDVAWARELHAFPLQEEPHVLRFHDLFLVTGGRGAFWLDGERYRVEPRQLFVTAPGQVRTWRVDALEGLCLFFPADFVEEFFSDPLFLHRLRFFHHARPTGALQLRAEEAEWLTERMLRMRAELGGLRRDSSHLLRAILYEVLITLDRIWADRSGARGESPQTETVFRFLELIERDFRREHQLAPYCRRLRISPGHLRTLTRSVLGLPAGALIRRRLAVEARRLLVHGDLPAQEIAERLGFVDPSYFGRFVKRETGHAPSELRRVGR